MPHSTMDHAGQMGTMAGMGQGAEGFWSMWDFGTLLWVLLIGVVYFYLVSPSFGRRFSGYASVRFSKKLHMIWALLFYFLGAGSPIGYYAHSLLFSAHMAQMALLYLLIPPFVYLAIPEWLVKPLFDKAFMKRIKPLMNPLFALFLFNLVFSIYHVPVIMNTALENHTLHTVSHWLLFIVAFHMWFPVYCPVKEWDRLSELKKIGYIFGNGILLTPACALIIFADSILYPHFHSPWEWLPPIDDQQLGGTIMKIMQEMIYGCALAYTFFKWYRKERRKEENGDFDEENTSFYAEQILSKNPEHNWNRA